MKICSAKAILLFQLQTLRRSSISKNEKYERAEGRKQDKKKQGQRREE